MGRITVDQSHQVVAALVTNTCWDEIDFKELGLQNWVIRNAQEAGHQFTAFLKNGARMGALFPDFMTIRVGTGLKSADDFKEAFRKTGSTVSTEADTILSNPAFTTASQAEDVDLVVLATSQLIGKVSGGTIDEVFAGAARLGLDKCKPEDGPQLRRQYIRQPLGGWLWIGMDPIVNSVGVPYVFSVEHDRSGRLLHARQAYRNGLQLSGSLWVFRHRKTRLAG